MKRISGVWGGAILLALTICTTVLASNREVNIKSTGVLEFMETDGTSAKIDSSDLRLLAKEIDELETWYRASVEEAYLKGLNEGLKSEDLEIQYVYHKHKPYKDSIVHSDTNPGGCYTANGHTHDATGKCGTSSPVLTRISYHHYGDFIASQFQCNCGYIARIEWAPDEPEPKPVCYNFGGHFTCGSPTNTWKLGCGKIEDVTIESATIVFPKGYNP